MDQAKHFISSKLGWDSKESKAENILCSQQENKIHRLKPISVNHNASNIQNDDGRGGGRMVIVFAIYSDSEFESR